jgi:capsular polysaccharide export protein
LNTQDRLRLVPGVLHAPVAGPLAVRISETAVPTGRGGQGWITRALAEDRGGEAGCERAAALVEEILRYRIGGDFWAPAPAWPSQVRIAVKLDQPWRVRDAVAFALSGASAEAVGVLLPKRRWAASAAAGLRRRGLAVHVGPADPWAVLDQVQSTHVDGDDDLGLLALLTGREMQVWSAGWLSGWGLAVDHAGAPPRGTRTVLQLAQAALIDAVRYVDPFSGRITHCEAIVEQLAAWRRLVDEDRDLACFAGMAWWKRARLRRFFGPAPRGRPFLDAAQACVARAKAAGGAVGVWPSLAPPGLEAMAREAGVPLRRIEDGFVRSVGLGSDLFPPCSIVVDRSGIYYDPTRPSDLEQILASADFSPQLEQRALALVERLQAGGVTKYNTGGKAFVRPPAARVVLVPGQVEDDQSLLLGGAGCAGNLDLVRKARALEPGAYIIYRPHPDVEAGNRVGAVADAEILRFADAVDRGSALPTLLAGVDALHVLTSLAGFEALLRGREVVTHGQPFYCGWGLTRDLAPPARRGRRLSLGALVAGTLILYPRYLDPVTGLPCPPEVLVDRLAGLSGDPGMATRILRVLRRKFEPGLARAAKPSAGGTRLGHA